MAKDLSKNNSVIHATRSGPVSGAYKVDHESTTPRKDRTKLGVSGLSPFVHSCFRDPLSSCSRFRDAPREEILRVGGKGAMLADAVFDDALTSSTQRYAEKPLMTLRNSCAWACGISEFAGRPR